MVAGIHNNVPHKVTLVTFKEEFIRKAQFSQISRHHVQTFYKTTITHIVRYGIFVALKLNKNKQLQAAYHSNKL